jgi:hypothetical protein
MGIFKNLINKVLDAEVPPVVEMVVKKGLAKKDVAKGNPPDTSPGQIIFSVEGTPADSKEYEKFREIADSTITDIEESGFFKIEKSSIIAEKIKRITRPGYGYSDPFSYEDCLTLDEKKQLGINTRLKFSREMFDVLTEIGIKHPNPKELIKNIWLKNFHKIHRKYDLERLRELGLKTVRIEDCGDERDCKAIKRIKKIWSIDEVPELPLPNCKAEYCRCSYIMDDESMFD